MFIVVVGAGQVGRSIAAELSGEHHIIVIEKNPDRADKVRSMADAMVEEGDGGDLDVLQRARVEEADMLIGCTDDDRTNILVANVANSLNENIITMARVKETRFLRAWQHSSVSFGVDHMVGSDALTAQRIVQAAVQPHALGVEYFSQKKVEMAEFKIPAGSPIAGKTVREADTYDEVRFVAVFHEEGMDVVRGDTVIPPDSVLLVIGKSHAVRAFGSSVHGGEEDGIERIAIFGGGEIGFQVASLLEKQNFSPVLVEKDRERAEFLFGELPNSLVLQNDALDPDFLIEEDLHEVDLVTSALDNDRQNLLSSLQARHFGVKRITSVVHEQKYMSLFEENGVDVAVNPRNKVVEEIVRHSRKQHLEKLTFVEDHRAEAIEIELDADSPLVGRRIADTTDEFPENFVIGSVERGNKIMIPRGNTVLEVGDDLVIFVETDAVGDVMERL